MGKLDRNLNKWKSDEFESTSIYRYRTINQFLFESLINNSIWFSDPQKLNDPFECQVKIEESADKIENSKNKYVKKIVNTIGIASFSLNNKNKLMWAHYANEHKGICLQYNISLSKTFFKPLKKVVYTNDYPIISSIYDGNEKIQKIILTKSKDWEYEEEVRVIKAKEKNYEFATKALDGIYFGAKTQDNDIETIKKLVKKFYGEKIKFYKMKLESDKFALKEEEINF